MHNIPVWNDPNHNIMHSGEAMNKCIRFSLMNEKELYGYEIKRGIIRTEAEILWLDEVLDKIEDSMDNIKN